jgi:hypothetical protein
MKLADQAAQLISIVAFLFYGLFCLFSEKTVIEFKRYGVPQFRKLTGVLEVSGALGLFAGYLYQPLTFFSSLGLVILMFMGMMVRIKIHDPWIALLPAFTLFCLNLYLCFTNIHYVF